MINKLKSIYFYLLYKVNKLKSAKIVCLEMVRLLCSEIWVFAFVGWRYVPSPPVLSRVNNNVMLIICHTVQHKIDFYLWNFKSTIRRMCLFMFWCWACHKTESTDLPFEYEHVCHGVIITLIDFMEITVVHISYACTGDENQVSLLIASAKQRFSLCESADRCADNHLYVEYTLGQLLHMI